VNCSAHDNYFLKYQLLNAAIVYICILQINIVVTTPLLRIILVSHAFFYLKSPFYLVTRKKGIFLYIFFGKCYQDTYLILFTLYLLYFCL